MRTSTPESLTTVALSSKALKNIEKLSWPKGAVMYCKGCGRESEKTPEQMQAYMKKWPRCCGFPADVKIKLNFPAEA